MLYGSVYVAFSDLQRSTFVVLELVRTQASIGEVDRAVKDALDAFAELSRRIGPSRELSRSQLTRHLGWMNKRYREVAHTSYASDVVDIQERDLPAVARAVQEWERTRLDEALADAIDDAWRSGAYRAVIRDAFVHLEERLRQFADIDPSRGLSGGKLVDAIFGPSGDGVTRLPEGALLGPVTGGERVGLAHLFRGAFLFARNPVAHRRFEPTADEAYALVELVDLCLRVIAKRPS